MSPSIEPGPDDFAFAVQLGNAPLACAIGLSRARAIPAAAAPVIAQVLEASTLLERLGQWALGADARRPLLQVLDQLPSTTTRYRDALRVRIQDAPAAGAARPGQAGVLFAADGRLAAPLPAPFDSWSPRGAIGAVQLMQVRWEEYGATTVVVHGANRDEATRAQLDRAFRIGVRVAARQVARLATEIDSSFRPTLHYYQRVASLAVEGRFPNLAAPIRGTSLALGAMVATISGLLGVAAPPHVAFTGAIDDTARSARLLAVGGMPEKLTTAALMGIERVFIPGAPVAVGDAPLPSGEVTAEVTAAGPFGCSVLGFDDLDAVVDALWPPGDGRAALHDGVRTFLRDHVRPAPMAVMRATRADAPVTQASRQEEGPLRAPKRLLISWVSTYDPWGKRFVKATVPGAKDTVIPPWKVGDGWEQHPGALLDGVVLAAIRHVAPTHILLLAADSPDREDGPTILERARGTFDMIRERWPDVEVTLIDDIAPERGVRDYMSVLNAMPDDVRRAIAGPDPSTEVVLNITAGTDAMTHAMLLLPELLRADSVRLVQVIDPRYVRTVEGRAEDIRLPALA